MANLKVRKLNNAVYEKLRLRAAKHGVSMEEEARQIISQTLLAPERISQIFYQHFGPQNGTDLEQLLSPKKPHDPMEL